MDSRAFFRTSDYPILCAPMATLSHRAHRELIEGFGGPSLYITEMISATALRSGAPYEEAYVDPAPDPSRLSYQLVGSEIEAMTKAASYLDGKGAFGVDVNMGCTAPLIVRQKAGIAWMGSIEGARVLMNGMRKAVVHGRLSAKVRLGTAEDIGYLVRFCQGLQDEGVDFITLHPRTASEKFRRASRWEFVAQLQAELRIPVIANGDIGNVSDYLSKKSRFDPTGIMVGRFSAKCPWAFALMRRAEARASGALPADDRFEVDVEGTAYRFLDLVERRLPADFHETRAKRFFFYYCDNFSFAHDIRWRIQNSPDLAAMRTALAGYFAEVPGDRVGRF
jgi:tRNA-dihydrouridine synthase B